MGSKQNYYNSYSCIWWSISQLAAVLEWQFSLSGMKGGLGFHDIVLAIAFKGCCWPNQGDFSDDLCSLSLKIRHKQLQKCYHQDPNSCSSWYILKLFIMLHFPLGLLGGSTMYKHLTAMPQVLWLWKLFYSHEALQKEISGCWKSWFPFSMGRMVVQHRDMTLGLTGAVTWGRLREGDGDKMSTCWFPSSDFYYAEHFVQ